MTTRQLIEEKLRHALAPSFLLVTDNSAAHAGHAEAKRSGGGHFHVIVVSEKFVGQKTIQRHRLIYSLLAAEMHAAIHALSIETLTLAEANELRGHDT